MGSGAFGGLMGRLMLDYEIPVFVYDRLSDDRYVLKS